MSAVMKPRRHPQTIRDAATARFKELAMPGAVARELGIPSNTVYFWWREFMGEPVKRKAKPPREYAPMYATAAEARAAVSSSDCDPADEAQ